MSLTGQFTEWMLGRVEPFVLELGTNEFRLLDASWQPGGVMRVRRVNRVPAPSHWVVSPHLESAIMDPVAFRNTLRQLFSGYKSAEKYVAVVLPDQACYLGFTRLSSVMLNSNPVAALEREIQSVSPLPLSCYDVRFEVQTARRAGTGGLLYAAITRGMVRELADNLVSEGLLMLSAQPSFVGMMALMRDLETEPSPHPAVWMHVGHEATTVAVYGGDGIKQIQIVPIGGSDWVRALRRRTGIDAVAARQLLFEGLILLEDPTSEAQMQIDAYLALEPLFSELLQKVYGLLQRHASDNPGEEAFRRIVISGGGTRLKRFDRLVKENLGIPVTVADTLVSPLWGKDAGLPAGDSASWLPLVAMLRQQPWRRQRVQRLVA